MPNNSPVCYLRSTPLTLKGEGFARNIPHGLRRTENNSFFGMTFALLPVVICGLPSKQRRQQIVGDCHQLKMDTDSFNENQSPSHPIYQLSAEAVNFKLNHYPLLRQVDRVVRVAYNSIHKR